MTQIFRARVWLGVLLFLASCFYANGEEPSLYELLVPEGSESPVIPIKGADDAAVVVVEVRSFSCTHCKQFHETVYPEIEKRLVDSGKVRWGMLDVTEDLKMKDPKFFELARCLDRQGLYWENQDFLFENEYQPSSFLAMDAEFIEGVDVKALRACFTDGLTSGEVAYASAIIEKKGMRILPTFFICKKRANGTWVEKRLEGAQSVAGMEKALNDMDRLDTN